MGSFLLDFLEFVILALFLKAMTRSLGSLFWLLASQRSHSAGTISTSPPQVPAHSGETARDPVCGMFVSTELSQKLKRGGGYAAPMLARVPGKA